MLITWEGYGPDASPTEVTETLARDFIRSWVKPQGLISQAPLDIDFTALKTPLEIKILFLFFSFISYTASITSWQ